MKGFTILLTFMLLFGCNLQEEANNDLDSDGDGIANHLDEDDDNDGIIDEEDAFPLDSRESIDSDMDNIGNNEDLDDDNDGYHDLNDAFPLDSSRYLIEEIYLAELGGSEGGAGKSGFAMFSVEQSSRYGFRVALIGDVNGDGIGDALMSADAADPDGKESAGQSFVMYGSNESRSNLLTTDFADGVNGFSVSGEMAGDYSAKSVKGAGDINGDGIDDVVVGATSFDSDEKDRVGKVYVIYGTNLSRPADIDLSTIDGINGFTIEGIHQSGELGMDVAGIGDINGDLIDDLLITAPFSEINSNSRAGEAYVIFGSSRFSDATFSLSSIDGKNGFVVKGVSKSQSIGIRASRVGDINHDGFDDFMLGSQNSGPEGRSKAGQTFVIFGADKTWPSSFSVSDLNGENGFAVNGINSGDVSGFSVSDAGDVNGDGIDDIVIGAPNAGDTSEGQSYVIYGSNGEWQASFELSSLDGSNGFILNGVSEGDFTGNSVGEAGDVNGDGLDDLIVGARRAESRIGVTYVVFGTKYERPSELNLSSVSGELGYRIIGEGGESAFGVAGGEDFNNDNIDDVIIGAPFAKNEGTSVGASYIIFGVKQSL